MKIRIAAGFAAAAVSASLLPLHADVGTESGNQPDPHAKQAVHSVTHTGQAAWWGRRSPDAGEQVQFVFGVWRVDRATVAAGTSGASGARTSSGAARLIATHCFFDERCDPPHEYTGALYPATNGNSFIVVPGLFWTTAVFRGTLHDADGNPCEIDVVWKWLETQVFRPVSQRAGDGEERQSWGYPIVRASCDSNTPSEEWGMLWERVETTLE